MAKKTKQKKSGMLKRQQQKRQKKMIRRRQAMPKRISQNHAKSEQIQQLLSTLPTLAFEPELLDLSMDKDKMKAMLESNSSEIDMLMELITDEFISALYQRLTKLEEANSEKSIKSVLSKATRNQIENSEKISNLSNPLLIAIFIKTRASVENSSLNISELPKEMEEFEKRNHKFIEELADQIENPSMYKGLNENIENSDEKGKGLKYTPAIEESVYKRFIELVAEEKREKVEEDLDVFLVDFKPPPIAEWDLKLIKSFLNKWFVENANPLEEDLYSMRESLLSLFQFLDTEKILPENLINQTEIYLKIEK